MFFCFLSILLVFLSKSAFDIEAKVLWYVRNGCMHLGYFSLQQSKYTKLGRPCLKEVVSMLKQWLLRCLAVTYSFLEAVSIRQNIISFQKGLTFWHDKLLWTFYCLKRTWSSVSVCLKGGCRVETLRCWAAPDSLTVTLHMCTFRHCWRPSHVLHLPSDHVQPKPRREVDDVVKQNKRAFTGVFHTCSANQELPCLETQCPLNNSMQW